MSSDDSSNNGNEGCNADEDLESRWRMREKQWRRKLGRLRLGVEPIEEQLARYRRVTWVLTAVPAVIGLMFLPCSPSSAGPTSA